jgi:hypothetical protein
MKMGGRGNTATIAHSKLTGILQARSRRARSQMACGQSVVTFGHGCLSHGVTGKIGRGLSGGKRGKRFARVNLARQCDWLELRRPAHVRAAVTTVACDRIIELVNRTSMLRDP